MTIRVQEDRISRRISNDMQELANMFIILYQHCHGGEYLVKLHEFSTIHFLCLIQGGEFDIFRLGRLVRERSLDFRHVMRSNSYERPIASEIGMQFILKGDERLISPFREFDSPKNCCSSIRSDPHGLRISLLLRNAVHWD